MTFPSDARGADWPGDALVTMTEREDGARMPDRCVGAGQLEALKGAVARHLDRFAFREAPLTFDWVDVD